jgi:hypothetical protein
MPTRVILAGLTPVGSQKMTLTSTTQSLNSTLRTADYLIFSVETGNARSSFVGNSTVPAKSTGVLWVAGQGPFELQFNRTSRLKFCRAQTTAGIINFSGFKNVGQP